MKYMMISLLAVVVLAGGRCEKVTDDIAVGGQEFGVVEEEVSGEITKDPRELARIAGEPATTDIIVDTSDEDYVMKITAEGAHAATLGRTVVEFDAPSTLRTVVDAPSGKVETIISDEKSYTNVGGKWIISSIAQVEGLERVGYAASDLAAMTQDAGTTYEGKKACSASLCHIYKITEGEDVIIAHIDVQKKRPVRVEMTESNGDKTYFDYTYEDVKIVLPDTADAITAPTLNEEGQINQEELRKVMEQFSQLEGGALTE